MSVSIQFSRMLQRDFNQRVRNWFGCTAGLLCVSISLYPHILVPKRSFAPRNEVSEKRDFLGPAGALVNGIAFMKTNLHISTELYERVGLDLSTLRSDFVYSHRRANAGSSLLARDAGKKQASSPTMTNTARSWRSSPRSCFDRLFSSAVAKVYTSFPHSAARLHRKI